MNRASGCPHRASDDWLYEGTFDQYGGVFPWAGMVITTNASFRDTKYFSSDRHCLSATVRTDNRMAAVYVNEQTDINSSWLLTVARFLVAWSDAQLRRL
ncbi:hypothetical protein DPEC_G00198270 [Dallia pectoralis]|uniref:Uncharacterized protein n=1 Tax=Dallia pectoralis TaxID=75939 RepID=A0ACC2G852_DALPE|nr:hypothetical protein DPEC_G00198270 [Dallia pectoralis]